VTTTRVVPGVEAAPEYLVIGHITADVVPGGTAPGGTALFAARTAVRLGLQTAIITSAPAAYIKGLALHREGISVHNLPAAAPSTFENIYHDGHRLQFLRARALSLGAADVPAAWANAGIVHFGPVCDEVARDLLDSSVFPQALRGATPQGWLRAWDAAGRVHTARGQAAADLIPTMPVLVFSEEDIERDAAVIAACREKCDVVAVTHGNQGATVYQGASTWRFPAYPTREVDPTGAGDVFAAAFLVRYQATGDLQSAGSYASVAASFVVEAPGAESIPTAATVEERLRHYPGR